MEGKVSTCPLLSGMGRCLLVLVGMGDGKVLLVWDGEVPTCLLLSRMGRFLLVSSYPGWEVSYLSPPRWDGVVPTCLLLGGMGRCLLISS